MKSTRAKHRTLIENHKRRMEDKEKENSSKCKQLIKEEPVSNLIPVGTLGKEAINVNTS